MYTIENVSQDTQFARDVFEIDRECFGVNCWSLELIKYDIATAGNIYIICKHQKEVVGFVAVSTVLDEAELNRIALKEKFRSLGLGTKLLNSLIKLLKQKNFKRLMLEVRSSNISAIELYKKAGFERDYIRKEYYRDPVDDAILMSLKL